MRILTSTNIDLIEPFPLTEAKRAFTWLHCYRNIVESDLSPRTPEEFEVYLRCLLPLGRSYGIIDKHNALGWKHEAPLVGMIAFEPSTIWNCYIHIASPRAAWGHGFMDEGVRASLTDIFATEPSIQRVSAYVIESNGPVKGLARRIGFRFEGCMRDMITQRGEPRNLLHFGVTRREWIDMLTPPPEQPPALPPPAADADLPQTSPE